MKHIVSQLSRESLEFMALFSFFFVMAVLLVIVSALIARFIENGDGPAERAESWIKTCQDLAKRENEMGLSSVTEKSKAGNEIRGGKGGKGGNKRKRVFTNSR